MNGFVESIEFFILNYIIAIEVKQSQSFSSPEVTSKSGNRCAVIVILPEKDSLRYCTDIFLKVDITVKVDIVEITNFFSQ